MCVQSGDLLVQQRPHRLQHILWQLFSPRYAGDETQNLVESFSLWMLKATANGFVEFGLGKVDAFRCGGDVSGMNCHMVPSLKL